MTLRLHIVVCSTRPTRIGPAIAHWFHSQAQSHGKFDAQLVDLVDFALPLFDEPRLPRLQQYEHEHTKRWAASVRQAHAFVFVTPEYNHAAPPSLVNAIDYLDLEWAYKPVAFVTYGGLSGGVRAAQAATLQASIVRMMPIAQSLPIPAIGAQMKTATDGAFPPTPGQTQAAVPLLDELHKLATALQPLQLA